MMKIHPLLIAGLLLTASLACNFLLPPATDSDPASATPTADQRAEITGAEIEYYEIRGQDANELRQEMSQLGPLDNGTRWDAYTAWMIYWNWPGYGTADCDLSQATTSLEVTVTLPRWANPAGAETALITHWNTYYDALTRHEQVHVNNAIEGFPKVQQAIQRATCATADQAAEQAIEAIRAADRAYDEQTGHGATQGARFP